MAEQTTIRDKLLEDVSKGLSTSTTTIRKHVSDVVGDEINPIISDIKSMTSGISSLFSSGFSKLQSIIPSFTGTQKTIPDIIGKQSLAGDMVIDLQNDILEESKKQTNILNNIWGYDKWKKKKDARTIEDDKDDDGGGLINAMVRGLAQALGVVGGFGLISGMGGLAGSIGTGLAGLGLGAMIAKMTYDGIKGWFEGDTLFDKSILATSGFLSLPGKILEWITNAVLWSLGKDFRVDISEKNIEKGLRNINDWLFKNITKPIFIEFPAKLDEWYNKYTPDFIKFGLESAVKDISDKLQWPVKILNNSLSYIKNLLTGNLVDAERDVRNITNNLINMGKNIFSSMGSWLMINTPIGDTIYGLEKIKDFFTKGGIKSTIQQVFDSITKPFNKYIIDPLKRLVGWFDSFFEDIGIDDIKNAVSRSLSIPGKILDWIKDQLPTWEDIKNIVGNISESIIEKSKGIGNSVKDLTNGALGSAREALEKGKDVASDAVKGVLKSFEDREESDEPLGTRRKSGFNPDQFRKQKGSNEDFKSKDVDKIKNEVANSKKLEKMSFILDQILESLKQNGSISREAKDTLINQNINSMNNMESNNKESDNPDAVEHYGLQMLNSTTLGAL